MQQQTISFPIEKSFSQFLFFFSFSFSSLLLPPIMAYKLLLLIVALAAAPLAAQALWASLDPVCDNGVFCDGTSRRTTDGSCTPLVVPCDDNDPDTIDTCDEKQQLCGHTLRPDYTGSPCRMDCTPNCTAKACGEDG